MKTRNFRDYLALFLAVLVFPGTWILQGLGMIDLPGEVLGVTVSIETMVALFYFRKKNQEPTP